MSQVLPLFAETDISSEKAERQASKRVDSAEQKPFLPSSIQAAVVQANANESRLLPTGIPELNRLFRGGLPRGKIVEITGRTSSGKTGLLFCVLAQATAQDEAVAYIDGFDSLDPAYAAKVGVDLKRLLWIRCKKQQRGIAGPLERVVKAADILVQGGGFGMIVLDVAPFVFPGEDPVCRIPLPIWFRLQRALKGTPATLVVLSLHKMAGSAASVTLALDRDKSCWQRRNSNRFQPRDSADILRFTARRNSLETRPTWTLENQFSGIQSHARLLRGSHHGSVTIHCHFQP